MRVRVDVDVEDVLSELSDEALLREVKSRGLKPLVEKSPPGEPSIEGRDLHNLEAVLRERRIDAALLLIERHTRPKFASIVDCVIRLRERRIDQGLPQ